MMMRYVINEDEILNECRSIQHATIIILLQVGAETRLGQGPKIGSGWGCRLNVEIGSGLDCGLKVEIGSVYNKN